MTSVVFEIINMAKKRKNLVLDENIIKCAEMRMKETHRRSLNNYVEHLILEDCEGSKKTMIIKDIIDGETIYQVKK